MTHMCRYQRQQIPFTIWSVVEDRRRVYQRQLAAKAYMKRAIEQHLEAHDPSWRVPLRAQQWEEEYRHALEAVSNDQIVVQRERKRGREKEWV